MEKQIPEGYKQTEVGVIPEDWDISALGDLVRIRSGESPSCFKFVGKGFPYFKVDELNNSEKFAVKTKYFISAADKLVPKGSLIFPKRGASIFQNKIRILKNDSYMDTNLMTLTVSDSISNEYCYYQLNYMGLSKVADTTSVPQINNKHIKPFYIPVPLQLEEQSAIATALSDVDNLITSLEQLIEKKKAIKQGTMQELLTGRRRLKGFGEGKRYKQTELGMIPEDWEARTLGGVAKIIMGQSPSSRYYNIGGYGLPLIQGNADIENRKTIKRVFTSEVTKPVEKGAIIMSVRAPVGEISKALFDACMGRGVCSLSYPNDYLYHYLIFIEETWSQLSTGSTFEAINSKNVKGRGIMLPCIVEEQIAVAQVLSDMDSEIEKLEAKVDKYKQIKQGMMQNLLTGRIRLV